MANWTGDSYIVVHNWERFQHYRDRNPLWIKVYARLLQDPAYLRLSLAGKGLLTVIWLTYSQQNCVVSVSDLRQICRSRVSNLTLDLLLEAGFIDISASKPLAAKKEKEKEKDSPKPPQPEAEGFGGVQLLDDEEAKRLAVARALDIAVDWDGGPSEDFDARLDDIEHDLEVRLDVVLRSRLWDQALKRDRERLVPDDFARHVRNVVRGIE